MQLFSKGLWLGLGLSVALSAQAATHHHSGGAAAAGKDIGLGLILGEPTGFSGKFWNGPVTAFDFGLAYSFDSFLILNGDFLYHFPQAFNGVNTGHHRLIPYLGGGAVVALGVGSHAINAGRFAGTSNSGFGLGLRIPLGIEWQLPTVPLGVFLELAPGMGLVPSTFAFLEGGIGARFYF